MFNVTWGNSSKTLMISRLIGDWNWDEFDHMQATMNMMITQSMGVVDIVYDFSESNQIPSGAARYISQMLIMESMRPGQTVIVNKLPIMSSLVNAFVEMQGNPTFQPVVALSSLAEAVTYLQVQRIEHQIV